jgi:hypothetical protein
LRLSTVADCCKSLACSIRRPFLVWKRKKEKLEGLKWLWSCPRRWTAKKKKIVSQKMRDLIRGDIREVVVEANWR